MWTYRQRIGEERMLAVQRQALVDVRARYVAPVDALVDPVKARGIFPSLPTEEIREILFDLLVNDAASLPLHGYWSPEDQRLFFRHRWNVMKRGLLSAA